MNIFIIDARTSNKMAETIIWINKKRLADEQATLRDVFCGVTSKFDPEYKT